MEEKSEAQLLHILENEHQFRPEAVRIAKEVLQEKQTTTEAQKNSTTSTSEGIKEESNSFNIDPKYALIAILLFQLLSSFNALPDLVTYIFSFPEIGFLNYLIVGFWFLLQFSVVISAVLILLKKVEGLTLIIVCSLLKLLHIEIGPLVFSNTDYLAVFLKVGTVFGFGFEYGSVETNFAIYRNSVENPFIGINLVTVIMLYWLFKSRELILKKGEFKRLIK